MSNSQSYLDILGPIVLGGSVEGRCICGDPRAHVHDVSNSAAIQKWQKTGGIGAGEQKRWVKWDRSVPLPPGVDVYPVEYLDGMWGFSTPRRFYHDGVTKYFPIPIPEDTEDNIK